MKRKIRLTESDLHNIIKESVNTILNEGNNAWNQGNGVIKQNLNVTYEEVRDVYAALYGYENYDGDENEYEQGVEEWWNIILSNARRRNQHYKTLPKNKRERQILKKKYTKEK